MPLYIEAIRAALRDALLEDERVFLLGEDIGHFGGAFGVTKGLTAIERARAGGGPQALDAVSLRGHGHAAHDDARYVPTDLRARVGDPVERLAARLLADGVPHEAVDAVQASAAAEVAAALEEAEAAPAPDPSTLEHGVYASPLG